ncbi:MAG: molybdopterin-dependent oxidoreductase [Pirellulales bacterium]
MKIRGACGHDCPDTCVWVADVDESGRAVKLAGDAEHPFTRGTLCAKVNHYLDRVYSPERVLTPLKRVGAKGEARFERVSWDAALHEIAQRWQAIIDESGAEAILPYSLAGNQGLIQFGSLDRRLFGLLGCSQLERNLCGVVASAGLAATNGSPIGIDPEDLRHSRLILLWGTNTLVTNLHLWPIIEEARAHGAQVVVIDPIRTRTAEAADWHVAVRPGGDAALALAMMHVLFRDGLADLDYLQAYTTGLEAFQARVAECSPAAMASRAGVSVDEIERLAHAYAAIRPSVIRPLIGMEHHRNGAMMFRTLACLPLVVGAWRDRGGGLCRSTGALQFSALDSLSLVRPHTHRRDVRTLNMRDLGRDLCNPHLQPPVRSLFVYNSNPAVTTPNQQKVVEGLSRDDLFTVVHDLFITETARYADLVLPATSQLEHLDIVPAWGHHYLSFNQPAIEPCGESAANTELFRRLARALGRTEPWLYEDDESLLRGALASGHPYLEGITFERLRDEGYVRLKTPADFRPYAQGGFPTPSGKAQLEAPTLAELGVDRLPTPGEILAAPADRPLQMISGKSLYYLNSSYCHLPLHRRRAGALCVYLHADDAAQRGVVDGQKVHVSGAAGRLVAECVVTDRVQPGVVWMPFGGRDDADGRLQSVNLLTPEEPTDWAGGSGFYDAFVEVTPA